MGDPVDARSKLAEARSIAAALTDQDAIADDLRRAAELDEALL